MNKQASNMVAIKGSGVIKAKKGAFEKWETMSADERKKFAESRKKLAEKDKVKK